MAHNNDSIIEHNDMNIDKDTLAVSIFLSATSKFYTLTDRRKIQSTIGINNPLHAMQDISKRGLDNILIYLEKQNYKKHVLILNAGDMPNIPRLIHWINKVQSTLDAVIYICIESMYEPSVFSAIIKKDDVCLVPPKDAIEGAYIECSCFYTKVSFAGFIGMNASVDLIKHRYEKKATITTKKGEVKKIPFTDSISSIGMVCHPSAFILTTGDLYLCANDILDTSNEYRYTNTNLEDADQLPKSIMCKYANCGGTPNRHVQSIEVALNT